MSHDALLVRGGESSAGLHGNIQGVFQRPRAGGDLVLNAQAIDKFHGEEAVLFVDFKTVRMLA